MISRIEKQLKRRFAIGSQVSEHSIVQDFTKQVRGPLTAPQGEVKPCLLLYQEESVYRWSAPVLALILTPPPVLALILTPPPVLALILTPPPAEVPGARRPQGSAPDDEEGRAAAPHAEEGPVPGQVDLYRVPLDRVQELGPVV